MRPATRCRTLATVRLLVAALVTMALSPAHAVALTAPYFAFDASAGGVLTPMANWPQALHHGTTTYVAHQGRNLDPYVSAYDHRTHSWSGPVKVGTNPHYWDTHGGPSVMVDRLGHLHVFYSPHHEPLRRARSTRPGRIDSWAQLPPLGERVTYPQAMQGPDGVPMLFYRRQTSGRPLLLDWTMRSATTSDAVSWGPETVVLQGAENLSPYASFRTDPDGTIRVAWLYVNWLQYWDGAWARYNVHYAERTPAGQWRTAFGEPLHLPIDTEQAAEKCLVLDTGTAYSNQIIPGRGLAGEPALMFITGSGVGPESYRFVYAQARDGGWSFSEIERTDHIFDAGEWRVEDGVIAAYVVAGGTTGEGRFERSRVDIGGEVRRYVSEDGSTWSFDRRLDPGKPGSLLGGGLYTPVKVVKDGPPEASAIFQERAILDDSIEAFGVYLSGDGGCLEATHTASVRRIQRPDRYGQAAAIAAEAHPQGTGTVVLVSGETFADALSAAPLAATLGAPILFTRPDGLPDATKAAIERLRVGHVVIIGGPASVSARVADQVGQVRRVSKVSRIAGADRYAVAAAVASELRALNGAPADVYLANGERFADGLAASSVGAMRRMPVLLTRADRLPEATRIALAGSGGARVNLVGGTASIDETLGATVGAQRRLGGSDRFAVASAVADHALSRNASPRRVLVTNAMDFPDAMASGVLSARLKAVLLTTAPDRIPAPTARQLARLPEERLELLVIGGPSSVSSAVEREMAAIYGR